MITRRELIGGAAAAGALSAASKYAPKYAGQTYVWSQHFDRRKEKLAEHREEVLAAFARAGYTHMELFTPFVAPEVAESTYELLNKYKLKAPMVYFGGPMHIESDAKTTVAKAVEFAERIRRPLRLEAINFNANPKPKGERKSDAELETQARAIDDLASQLAKQKVRLFIHQHAPEMAENAREWRHILRNTDKQRVEICLDVHWIYRGGQDVMTLLEDAAPRLASMHLRNSKDKVWLEELADGDVDYRAVAGFLRRISYRGWLIPELAWDKDTAITRPLEENIRRSLEYAKKVFA
jgi:inosose dehydratase